MVRAGSVGAGSVRTRAARTRGRAELRTHLATIDPGLTRLRLASIAVASMLLGVGVTQTVRSTLAPDEPVTVLLFSGVLAMVSNLAVNEPDLARRRVTTGLMLLPAAAATVAGTLLTPYRIPAAVVIVAIMMAAVWVRRWGPRGFALGMAAFMPYFFTQFLRVQPAQLPWLLVAATTGIGSTLLLRGVVFAERPERTLRRLVEAFRARAWATLGATDDVLAALSEDGDAAKRSWTREDGDAAKRSRTTEAGPRESDLERMRRARARLNQTALLVEDQLEQTTAARVWSGLDDETLALRIFDAELGLERLTVAVRRLARPPDGTRSAAEPLEVAALRIGLARLRAALRTPARHDEILEATADARGAVAGLVADTRAGHERLQRVAFAVHRLTDAVHHAQRDAPARSRSTEGEDRGPDRSPAPHGPGYVDARRGTKPASQAGKHPTAAGTARAAVGPEGTEDTAFSRTDRPDRPDEDGGLALSTRQAVQVGVGASLAIVVGELIAPTRWYWAVIAAFVVFAGTQSRGDLLGRGWGRIVGTALGVAAGMGLATLVAGQPALSLVLLLACVFLALYLVRVSPALLAFWVTAVLALVYGLTGQFSVEVLLLRIEETVIGSVASILAGFLVLPRGTRDAFGEAVDDLVDTMDDVLAVVVDRLAGDPRPVAPRARAREMDTALDTLRQRTRPLTVPAALRRGRSSYQRGLRVLVVCDHYTRGLARLTDDVCDPGWRSTLRPAGERVRANLDALRDVLVRGRRRSDGRQVVAISAEALVDAAEAHAAARAGDPARRTTMLSVTRLLRRIDQAVVGLAVDLGAAEDTERAPPAPVIGT